MSIDRGIDDVEEALRNAKARGKKCALLIGAGCSVRADIPTASGFVDLIKNEWPVAYKRAATKTYSQCMAQLADGERRDLIADKVEKAKINWAHIGIAQLMKEEYVDRVLTTNFDPLVLRACALVNFFPAVYDFAASQRFNPAYTPEQAIFHLHGQHTGFVLLNTKEQVNELSTFIEPLFEDAWRGRLWLVVGYSGENDPVFEHLTRVKRFDQRLYWVGYQNNEPPPHVREHLLSESKSAYYVRGFDADSFFVSLGQRLRCFPPEFVEKPFTHLDALLDRLASYVAPGETREIDLRRSTRPLIQSAIKEYEQGRKGRALRAESHLLSGRFDEVLTLLQEDRTPKEDDLVRWALTMQGNALLNQARTKAGKQADRLFKEALRKFEEVINIKPDMHKALNNWAAMLLNQARTKDPVKEGELLNIARQKCIQAESISPGAGAYHLACIASRERDEKACQMWLEKSRNAGLLPNQDHLIADSDLENVQNSLWHKAFIDSL